MSENQTTTPVPLPPPLRFLTEDENNAVWDSVRAAVSGFFPNQIVQEDSVKWAEMQTAVFAALGSRGLFTPPPQFELRDESCHAWKVAWDTTQWPDRENLGQWISCDYGRGHCSEGATFHYDPGSAVADWSDGEPGTVPDTRTA
ncbi:hypothetical protein [Nonomuraea sp. CA-141351]|uniref:hypothetical protein n=1 Tax=Nonomuraea sp. CA-141351 TaxID=3239996 RepID=UPI003D8A2383